MPRNKARELRREDITVTRNLAGKRRIRINLRSHNPLVHPPCRCGFFYFFYCPVKRRLWIDPEIVREALPSKEALDALALCCMVKLTFADSMVRDATVRRMMHVFHVSYGRLKNALDEGLRRGYFRRAGSHLRASRVRTDKSYCVPLDIPVSENKGECLIGIARMCDQLRGAVLYNHIVKQNDLRDTTRLARSPRKDEFQLMKRAKARLRKKGVCVEGRTEGDGLRLSYARVASLLNVSRTKAKAAIKRLRDRGLIRRELQFEETGLHLDDFTREVQSGYSRYGGRGFMVLNTGMVCLQLANAYLLCGDSLVRFIH